MVNKPGFFSYRRYCVCWITFGSNVCTVSPQKSPCPVLIKCPPQEIFSMANRPLPNLGKDRIDRFLAIKKRGTLCRNCWDITTVHTEILLSLVLNRQCEVMNHKSTVRGQLHPAHISRLVILNK